MSDKKIIEIPSNVIGSNNNENKIIEHVEKYLGPIYHIGENEYNDMKSQWLFVEPTEEMPFIKVVTCGMSNNEMPLLEGEENKDVERYVETLIILPIDWKIDEKSLEDQRYMWPFDMLNNVSIFPSIYKTRIGSQHTIVNSLNNASYAYSTKLNSCLLLPSISVPQDFNHLIINKDKTIHFLNIYPLYPEELNLKINNGLDNLLDLFMEHQIMDVIAPNRKNVAKKKWFLF